MTTTTAYTGTQSSDTGSAGYTLVICEKPDAARRVAEALSESLPEPFNVGGVHAFRVEDRLGRRYVVCAAAGHLYGLSDTVRNRRVYPVADLEWFPVAATGKASKLVQGRIRAIRSLSEGASAFVNACDLDVEGETIGYNILRYACGGKEASAVRARLSSLTKEDVVKAFGDGALTAADGLAMAGRLRHAVDFLWGVNLSRALSESVRTSGSFRTLSIGRVQGPTLSFLVEREVDVRTFVPIPYWTAKGRFRAGDLTFEARYSSVAVIPTERAAGEVKAACEGEEGVVAKVSRRKFSRGPPAPFNLADLQGEAFRLLGYAPSKTLQLAERLYLGAIISYPRTGSQKLPKLDFRRLLSKIGAIPGYSVAVGEVLARGAPRPAEGQSSDPAHPAIYPTGEAPKRPLVPEERRLFDLIVRRFVACFAEDAVYESGSADIVVRGHEFRVEETGLVAPGWTKPGAGQRPDESRPMLTARVREGDLVVADAVSTEEHLRMPVPRYNQATLLEKMEREGIGTKATRADTISTLLGRGYVSGQALVPTELGFALVEVMGEHCPQIISTRLTREVETQLERIEGSGDVGWEFFEGMLSTLMQQVGEVRSHSDEIAGKVGGSDGGPPGRTVLGRCPACKEGKLWVVRSRTSGKRFVGCTNYSKGCRASAPLPQRGSIKAGSKLCRICGWPVVYVRLSRRPWRLCVNDRCPRKVNVYAMRDSQKKG